MRIYYYQDTDHSDGNALAIVADCRDDADTLADTHGKGISSESYSDSAYIEAGLVVAACSYYRPWIGTHETEVS